MFLIWKMRREKQGLSPDDVHTPKYITGAAIYPAALLYCMRNRNFYSTKRDSNMISN